MKKVDTTFDISYGVIWKVIGVLALVWFLFFIRDILLLLFLAIVVVSAAQPIVDRLEKRKIPRTISALVLYLIFFAVFAIIIWLVIPGFMYEMKLLAENIPAYFSQINQFFLNLTQFVDGTNFGTDLQSLIRNSVSSITNSFSNIFSNTIDFLVGLLKFLVIASLSFYLLVKKNGIKGFLRGIIPKEYEDYAFDLIQRIQVKMGRWMLGQFALMIIIFGVTYPVLLLLGIPFALVLSLFAGLMELIPYVGPVLVVIPVALIGLTISPLTALFVILAFIIIQQLENHIIAPLIMKKAVGLNPVTVILALLIGGKLAGLLGVIIAVPFATALEILIGDLINKRFLLISDKQSKDKE